MNKIVYKPRWIFLNFFKFTNMTITSLNYHALIFTPFYTYTHARLFIIISVRALDGSIIPSRLSWQVWLIPLRTKVRLLQIAVIFPRRVFPKSGQEKINFSSGYVDVYKPETDKFIVYRKTNQKIYSVIRAFSSTSFLIWVIGTSLCINSIIHIRETPIIITRNF